MPEAIRASSVGGAARRAGLCGAAVAVAPFIAATLAVAQTADTSDTGTEIPLLKAYVVAFSALDGHEMSALALTLGAIAFAVVTAVMLVRVRTNMAAAHRQALAEIAVLRSEADRSTAMLLAEPQVLVVFGAADDEPDIIGDTAILTTSPVARRALAFGTWLPPDLAQAMTDAVAALRERGAGFTLMLTTLVGRHIEAEGRAVGGRAILRLRDVSGAKHALADLTVAHQKLAASVEPLRQLVEAFPAPVWAHNADGRLSWVNAAYARAVEAHDCADAVTRQLELLERAAREEVEHSRAAGLPYHGRAPVVVDGDRRVVDVFEFSSRTGSVGIGIDVTEVEIMRAEMARMMDAHRRTLDQLPTAVAIFTAKQRLAFSNAAYRRLWDLDPGFLEQQPTDASILDRLRANRKLPEQADFRQWRNQLFEAYRAIEAQDHLWHLPDGRTLRVVTTPNPEGGVTYLFDDVSEPLELKRNYDALSRVQGETLDNLAEAVAVFASDGRLRLFNPAFSRMWRVTPALLAEHPHIERLAEWCTGLAADASLWQRLRGAVTGLESRESVSGRLERYDGSVIDCATVPLPDGATLIAFQDATDTVNVERALRERNDALVAADELKNEFVHHVSYELRTPLTNIIGFAHLLKDDATGPLTDKQREYLGYISSSSGALLAIINDILDLASIDAGAMKLDLGAVDVRRTIDAAAEGVRDRLAERGLRLDVRALRNVGSFMADERRIRQILFNLLSNAIAFSGAGGAILLTAERRPDAIVLSVADRGRGIPSEIVDRVFSRFESHALGSQHRGAGLGLSIVRSFVELHGGTVTLHSVDGEGTTVTCVFPLEQVRRVAA